MISYRTFLFFLIISTYSIAQNKIKVAAVGNSVTYGTGLPNPNVESYPAQLQKMLGNSYEVKNFGKPGATLLSNGHKPYVKTQEYNDALTYAADIIIIHLGLNDTDPRNWPRHKDNFHEDYYNLIDSFKQKNAHAKVFICQMTPIFPAHPRFGSSTLTYYDQIQDAILEVAQNTEVELIDINSPLRNRNDLFPDALHPNPKGAHILAETIYQAITKNYGSLSLDKVFTNHMVLQRNAPISFWGTGKPHQRLSISFAQQTKEITIANNGKWEVTFPAASAGGPFKATFQDHEKTIELNQLWVGDVWIAAGQSNMAFQLKDDLFYEASKVKTHNNLSIYNPQPITDTYAVEWNAEILKKVNEGDFFHPTSWEPLSPKNANSFSAIAYYFGAKIQEEVKIPIGIISLPFGGSTTESWISRKKTEHDPLLLNLLKNWDSDYTDSWARERTKLNLKKANNPNQQHPYKPTYLYENGMKHFEKLPIAGVIWYQGESNASNIELHEQLFTKMIEDWRERRKTIFPVYFVQLSSLQRDTWVHFRNSQRLLAKKIPSTGMVVSSDVGDKKNVHPKNKKAIGLRLASYALADYYKLDFNKCGPVFQHATLNKNEVLVDFTEAKKLKTKNGEELSGFEVASKNKIFHPVKAIIKGHKVILKTENITSPSYIRYGWQAYSNGNLTDEDGLPTSTFYSEIKK